MEAWNNNKLCITALYDLSKAFDCVHHNLLLTKMYNCGIRGIALDLFESYLENRTQIVQLTVLKENIVKDVYSERKKVIRGVPQGSIIGPILFIIYINNLPEVIKENVVLFADDTAILYENANEKDITEQIDISINFLNNWFDDNNLRLNIAKTQFIKFGNYGDTQNNLLLPNVGNISLQAVVKFLGLNMDKHLAWKYHIDSLTNKISKYIYLIRTMIKNVPLSVVRTAYMSLIQSNIQYGIIFWGHVSYVKQLFLMQKRAIRAICQVGPRESCRSLFKNLQILTVTDLYVLSCATFVKKYPQLFQNQVYNHPYTTRNKDKLVTMQSKLSVTNNNPLNAIIRVYNKLPTYITSRDCSSLTFKNDIKKILYNYNYYNLEEFFNTKFYNFFMLCIKFILSFMYFFIYCIFTSCSDSFHTGLQYSME